MLAQMPPVQTFPWPQAFPHVPQFALSVWVLAQKGAPPSTVQSVWFWVQVLAHVPPAQTVP